MGEEGRARRGQEGGRRLRRTGKGDGGGAQEHAARRVDADLCVQVVVRQRQLHGLADLLLLDVAAADVGVRNVGLLVSAHQRDRRVCLGWEDVDDGIRVPVEGHRRARLQQLAVDRREDAHVVVGARGARDDAVVVVDDLEELADDERHRLDALDLLLRAHELALQILHLVLDVILLDLKKLKLALERLHPGVLVAARGLRRRGRRIDQLHLRIL